MPKDDITITPINRPATQAIVPSRPLPEGQVRAPTRDANPRMSVAIGENRLGPVRAGGVLQYRVHAHGRVSTWAPLAHEGEIIELRTVDAAPPQRRPYTPGT